MKKRCMSTRGSSISAYGSRAPTASRCELGDRRLRWDHRISFRLVMAATSDAASMGPGLLGERAIGLLTCLPSDQHWRIRTISTIHPTIAKVFGLPTQSTHSDSCHAAILISTTWDSTTKVWLSTAKERAENRGRQSEHDYGEPPSTGITTTSLRSNGVGSVPATF